MYNLKNLSDPNVFNITVDNGCAERVKNWKVLDVIFEYIKIYLGMFTLMK